MAEQELNDRLYFEVSGDNGEPIFTIEIKPIDKEQIIKAANTKHIPPHLFMVVATIAALRNPDLWTRGISNAP